MALDAATLRASWRAWWSPTYYRGRPGPGWLQWLWTFLFNCAIAIGLTLLGWGIARRIDPWTAFQWNFVIAQSVGFTIHLLFAVAQRLLGAARMDRFTWQQRVAFFAGIPIAGVFIGYGVGLAIMGVDVPQLVVERPSLLVAILLLSLLLSTFWYRFMANKARLAEAEAERERQHARAAELERQALDAQLRSLQAQIEPHFLFNTLANVVSLIDTAPADARRMLEKLIALLRQSLAASRAEQVSLGQETDLLRAYLDILSIRMGQRLSYEIDVPEELRGQRVLPLLVQPLVENAIQHGLEPKVEGGTVRVRAWSDGRALALEVSDDGLGFGSVTRGGGVGLANLRQRLAAHYGERGRLSIEDAAPGTRVRLSLPLSAAS
jgi:signal transduction histidine kinase